MASPSREAGGFLIPTLPSPPAPTPGGDPTNQQTPAQHVLRPTRSKPLQPGSSKETAFIHYVDGELLGISRRYEKRFNAGGPALPGDDPAGRGYEGFGEMAGEMNSLVDVVWTSGTRKGILSSNRS